ncbi:MULTISPECIES: gpW family head-tail joining protein [Marinobacter]|uniref:gpW family head-tail joining protein n=1 Tax=Marinobacter TaxID=2742 RepID=UPI0012690092|nr:MULTISPECIES: gpW family head-tail joining protein [unclassified Marinobacter]QFS86614.1 gpW [Marinobacter sp. THAF197a]QFT50398.1 gpW [Marinobacter sp. THAF39]QFT52920.1 gpW [Marinobacter sp. THAF39]
MTTVADRLAEAESEYHALITGNKPRVVVDQNGERVEFTAANAGRLRQYIESLRAQLSSTTRGPMRVYF